MAIKSGYFKKHLAVDLTEGAGTPQFLSHGFLEKYIGELEAAYQENKKELDVLIKELNRVTRDGAMLNERKAYTDRVIELLKALQALEEKRQSLLGETGKMPQAPPLLKLVAIEIPDNLRDYEKNGAGLVFKRRSEIPIKNGDDVGFEDTIASLRIVEAPLEIQPTRPFTIKAEAMMRKT